ncbi:hypothetical protein IFR05_005791 [Cadophora sp. M221]|nr:hypothetical protein IFR05_005791 [Cadophora sp. M221]
MDLQLVLASLGITCYWHVLLEAGFETWEILKDITERDMYDLHAHLHSAINTDVGSQGGYRDEARPQKSPFTIAKGLSTAADQIPEAAERNRNIAGPPNEHGLGTVRDMLL